MEENSKTQVESQNSWNWKELLKLIVISGAIVIPFRLYVAQPFIVDGLSMYPTLHNGDYLIVDELSYHFRGPARGEVLVFRYPKDPSKSFVKRVIGLPGETVSIQDGAVTITGNAHPQGLTLEEPYIELKKSQTLSYTLDQDEYFVMGDNREQSADSRLWGAVPEENIVGRPILRAWPFGFLPGNYTFDSEEDNS